MTQSRMVQEITTTHDGYSLPVGTWVWGCLRYNPKYSIREYKGEKLLLNAYKDSVFVFFFDRKECTKYIKNIEDMQKAIATNLPNDTSKLENDAILQFSSVFNLNINTVLNFINNQKSNQ